MDQDLIALVKQLEVSNEMHNSVIPIHIEFESGGFLSYLVYKLSKNRKLQDFCTNEHNFIWQTIKTNKQVGSYKAMVASCEGY